ncbi:MAG: hypothetical protein L0H93_02780 [Nocardioides sp.]|nr:hypothetical protein [Nocardioides sp.]
MESNSRNDLTSLHEARAALADRLITPWWYHPALGALVAGLALAYGLIDHDVWRLLSLFPFFGGCALLVAAYRRATGIWINGNEAGPARIHAWALGLSIFIAMVLTSTVRWQGWPEWIVWAVAAAVFVFTVAIGRRFDRAYREHLRSQP